MNRGYKLGNGSQTNVNTTVYSMHALVAATICIANTRKLHCPDFSIIYGLRTAQEQYAIYQVGRTFSEDGIVLTEDPNKVRTYCDGVIDKSTHQSGLAIDFAAWVNGKSNFEPVYMMAIALCFFEAASNLGLDIDWGGSYRSISDLGHIEILESK